MSPILDFHEETLEPVDPRLGARIHFDRRSLLDYPVSDVLPAGLEPRSIEWRIDVRLNQGAEGACVGFSAAGEVAADPVMLPADNALGFSIYREAKTIDPWPGEDYEGTSQLAGLQILKKRGYIGEYRWARTWEDFQLSLSHIGPQIVATSWYDSMFNATGGTVKPSGKIVGRHSYLIVANDVANQRCLIHNSWGKNWGKDGRAWIAWSDLKPLLIDRQGEMAVIMTRLDPSPKPEPEPKPVRGICPFATFIPGVTSFSRGHIDRMGFCDHTAAGYMGTMKDAGFWNRAGVSAHFAISKKGEIVQLVNIFDTAFAQGRLGPKVTWPPYGKVGGNPNGFLISIEHEDETERNMVWPEAMYQADLKVKQWCIEECKAVGRDLMQFGIDSLAGHHMFDGVNRADCPGDGWPRERLYRDLTGAKPSEVEGDGLMIVGHPDNPGDYLWAKGKLHWIPNAKVRDDLMEAVYRPAGAPVPRLSKEAWEFLEKVSKS